MLAGCKMDTLLRRAGIVNSSWLTRYGSQVHNRQRLQRLQANPHRWVCLANQAKFASTSVTTPPLTTLQAAPTTCSHFLETKAAADRLHPRPNKGPPQSVSQWEKLTWWQRCDIGCQAPAAHLCATTRAPDPCHGPGSSAPGCRITAPQLSTLRAQCSARFMQRRTGWRLSSAVERSAGPPSAPLSRPHLLHPPAPLSTHKPIVPDRPVCRAELAQRTQVHNPESLHPPAQRSANWLSLASFQEGHCSSEDTRGPAYADGRPTQKLGYFGHL